MLLAWFWKKMKTFIPVHPPVPAAHFTGEDLSQRHKGAKSAKKEKGVVVSGIIVLLQDQFAGKSCPDSNTLCLQPTTPFSSLGVRVPKVRCAFAAFA